MSILSVIHSYSYYLMMLYNSMKQLIGSVIGSVNDLKK